MIVHRLRLNLLLSFLALLGMQSCVDRVSIPEDNFGKLFINCEMQTGSTEVTATLATSTNFNGQSPISNPTEARIVINLGGSFDDRLQLKYDEDRQLYFTSGVSSEFWRLGNGTYLLTASVPDTDYPEVVSTVRKLPLGSVKAIREVGFKTITQDGLIQKEIEIELADPQIRPAYYHLHLNESLTVQVVDSEGAVSLVSSGASLPITIDEVSVGGAGLIPLQHREGILIDQSRLTDNKFTLLVTSAHEQVAENQVFKTLDTQLDAVSKIYYDYHKAYSNTVSSVQDQYVDPPIWSNNIEDGVGLFSLNTVATKAVVIEE